MLDFKNASSAQISTILIDSVFANTRKRFSGKCWSEENIIHALQTELTPITHELSLHFTKNKIAATLYRTKSNEIYEKLSEGTPISDPDQVKEIFAQGKTPLSRRYFNTLVSLQEKKISTTLNDPLNSPVSVAEIMLDISKLELIKGQTKAARDAVTTTIVALKFPRQKDAIIELHTNDLNKPTQLSSKDHIDAFNDADRRITGLQLSLQKPADIVPIRRPQ